ncbi:MAG: glycosyltransferase family 4 protein [Chloroflexota bacterium]
MSRVLFLTPQLPYPPHQGAAIRNLNLAKLAAREHEVNICSFIRGPAEVASGAELARWAARVDTAPAPRRGHLTRLVQSAFSLQPDMQRRLHSEAFRRLVGEADLVQAEGIEMAQYLTDVPGPRVLDCHNAEWLLQRRAYQVDVRSGRWLGAAYSALQWLKLRRYERWACRAADAVLSVSQVDRQALLSLDARLSIDVLPNGVDTSVFRPAAGSAPAEAMLFTGTLDFRPNVDALRWMVDEVWPRIRRQLPQATLTIAGRAPSRRVLALGQMPGVTVLANPPDIMPCFHAASVYAVPVRSGGGTRYKLLQAMACGLGIVSTTVGAEGVAVHSGEELLVADSSVTFAEAAIRLMRDAPLRRRLGARARENAAATYDWCVLAPALLGVYGRLLAGRP